MRLLVPDEEAREALRRLAPPREGEPLTVFGGVPVVVSALPPPDEAWLVSAGGRVQRVRIRPGEAAGGFALEGLARAGEEGEA